LLLHQKQKTRLDYSKRAVISFISIYHIENRLAQDQLNELLNDNPIFMLQIYG